MSRWVLRGLKSGVVTTRYPSRDETAPGISPGFPSNSARGEEESTASLCPTGALIPADGGIGVDRSRCVHCFRCARGLKNPVEWNPGFEWARIRNEKSVLPKAFSHSMNIRVVDAGDCGACLNEVKLLNNPFYNMHRLGFFITPTPRKADILLVVGPVTAHMKTALMKTYEAMPTPRRVMAVGTCALSGGLFGPGFAAGGGIGRLLPVDVEIPGCPPPPLAVLHGLLLLAGREKPSRSEEGGSK